MVLRDCKNIYRSSIKDNVRFHHYHLLKLLALKQEFELMYTACYSLMCNPTEYDNSALKQHLRRLELSWSDLPSVCNRFLDSLSFDQCKAFFQRTLDYSVDAMLDNDFIA